VPADPASYRCGRLVDDVAALDDGFDDGFAAAAE